MIIETTELKICAENCGLQAFKMQFYSRKKQKQKLKKQKKGKKSAKSNKEIRLKNRKTVDFACIQQRFGTIGV